MKFVVAGWCARKWFRINQATRNLISGDFGILLVAIQLGVTRLKKARVVHLLDLIKGNGQKMQCDSVCVECL